jgi:hypothetical protein
MSPAAVCSIRPHPQLLFRAREWARNGVGQTHVDSAPPESGWRARCSTSDAGEASCRVNAQAVDSNIIYIVVCRQLESGIIYDLY